MKVYVYPLLETLERANVHGMFLKCQMDDITTKLFSRAYLGGYEAKNHYKRWYIHQDRP